MADQLDTSMGNGPSSTGTNPHGLWDDARQGVQDKLNEQKDVAARGIGDAAGALRDAAQRQQHDGDGTARLTNAAADGLDRLSQSLRNKDVNTMLHDMESFARQQPVAFFGLALAAGFLAVRLAKSANP